MPMLQTVTDSLRADSLAADSLAAADTLAQAVAPAAFSAADFFVHGGWALVVIAGLALAAVAVAVGVSRAARDLSADSDTLLRTVGDYVRGGNLVGALDFCRSQDTPAARLVSEGLQRLGRPLEDIQAAIGASRTREMVVLQQRLGLVAACAALATAIGLLGSASGLLTVLRDAGDAVPVASTLWPILIPSVVGPLVSVVVGALYYTLTPRAGEATATLDATAADFLALLKAPAPDRRRNA